MAWMSAARLPGLMAASAVLATAASSANLSERLLTRPAPILFYPAYQDLNRLSSSVFPSSCTPVVVPCSASSRSVTGFGRSSLTDLSLPSSLSWAQAAPSALPAETSLPCLSGFCSPGCRLLPQRSAVLHSIRFPTSCLLSTQNSLLSHFRHSCSPHSTQQPLCRFASSEIALSIVNCRAKFQVPYLSFSSDFNSIVSSLALKGSSGLIHSSQIPTRALHTWHTPYPGSFNDQTGAENGISLSRKPAMTVVLLGWLGAQQKHLRKYAEWYNARGIHAVTFVIPMSDVLRLTGSGKAEEYVDELTSHLALWLAEESDGECAGRRNLIFHTFSMTGWLTYGVLLESLALSGNQVLARIKGCVVDSAPAADPDPQVWAEGFSAALLKKRSSATIKGIQQVNQDGVSTPPPHMSETAFLAMLEKFFYVFLQIPAISGRLSKVVDVLIKQQPPCPQLYMYSSADRVIPADRVESFIENQRVLGRTVSACNLQTSPHVDHFRTFPEIYGNQVSKFLKECVPEYVA